MAATAPLYARPEIIRGEQCAGARPHAGRCWQLSSGGGGQGRGAGAITAEPSWVAERPRRRDPGEVGPPSGWSPAARMLGRRPGRSLPVRLVRSAVGCPSNRSSGRPAFRRPVPRRPRPPGVRTDRPLVSAALPPPCPRRAGPGVARCGRPPRPGAAGPRAPCPVVRGRRGRLPASGLTRRGWCGVGRGWLARGSTVAQGRRLAGVPAAAPPGRRADTGAGPVKSHDVV
jgi:hypothetical protein